MPLHQGKASLEMAQKGTPTHFWAVLGGVLQEDLTHSGLLSTFGASHGAWNSP